MRSLLACIVAAVFVLPTSAQGLVLEKDVVYGKAGDVELLLDVCKPRDTGAPRPAVICIHGGAWIIGHRNTHLGTIQMLANEGFVAATISYRLAPKHTFPAQLEDAKCAIRFVRSKAKEWNIDPNRIAVLGDSAGGHLSLLAGLMNGKVGFEGDGGNAGVSSKVQAIVNFYGPTDFTSWKLPIVGETMLKLGTKRDSSGILVDFLGTSDRKADVMKVVSPLTYISKDSPPVLTFNGTADPLVPDQQARVLHEALDKVGAPNRLEILPNAGHGWMGPLREKTNGITIEFLRSSLK